MERLKTCSKCSATQPTTAFSKSKAGKYGVKSWCKRCCAEHLKAWKARNAAAYKAQRAGFWLKNSARLRAQHRKWLQENRENQRAYHRKRRELDNGAERRRAREIYALNRESQVAKMRASRDSLSDGYVRRVLNDGAHQPLAIPKPLIELKRVQLQITRELRKRKK